MSAEKDLQARSGNKCELCGSAEGLSAYIIPPSTEMVAYNCVYTCNTCKNQLENPDTMDSNHWRCLNDTMWSDVPSVQVVAYRTLHALKSEGWPQDLLNMLYLDDETKKWAMEGIANDMGAVHKDSNGNILKTGDSVVLIKTLDVKGSSLSAKMGTTVRKIALVPDNPEQIEGKVEGQQIVILTKFVKKVG